MFVLLLFIISAIATAVLAVVYAFSVTQILLAFLCCFLGLHLILAVTYLLAGLMIDTKKPMQRQSRFFTFGAWWISNICCTYGLIRTEIIGKQLIPENSRFLMISNHRSGFDPLIVLNSFPEFQIAFISKASNMTLPLVGNIAYGACFLGIDRENDRNALKTIITASNYIKSGFCSVFIYPEGTRSKDGEMLPFHAGSFKIAQKAHVPLVITAITGTERLKRNAFRRRTRVQVEVVEVLTAERVQQMSTAELSAYSREKINQALKRKEGINA